MKRNRRSNRRWLYALLGVVAAALATGIGFAQTFAAQSSSGTLQDAYATTYAAGGTGAPGGKYGTTWAATLTAHKGVSGTVPTGDLFVISNPNNYDGNLEVVAYLTNTGALASNFKYLNVEVGLWYATGSGTSLTWTDLADQYLSLQQGAITFDVPAADFYNGGAGAGLLSVSVDGGDYLTSTPGTFSINTFVKANPETGNT